MTAYERTNAHSGDESWSGDDYSAGRDPTIATFARWIPPAFRSENCSQLRMWTSMVRDCNRTLLDPDELEERSRLSTRPIGLNRPSASEFLRGQLDWAGPPQRQLVPVQFHIQRPHAARARIGRRGTAETIFSRRSARSPETVLSHNRRRRLQDDHFRVLVIAAEHMIGNGR